MLRAFCVPAGPDRPSRPKAPDNLPDQRSFSRAERSRCREISVFSRKQIDQRRSGFDHLAANVVNKVVRALAAHVRGQAHHHRLGDDQALGDVQILAHALFDRRATRKECVAPAPARRQPAEKFPEARSIRSPTARSSARDPRRRLPAARPHAAARRKYTRKCNCRRWDCASAAWCCSIRARERRARPLRPTSVCIMSFTSVATFPSVPVTRPRKHPTSAKQSRAVCQAIAGWPSFNSRISAACTSRPRFAKRGERAGGASKFADQQARTQFGQARAMPLESRQQHGHLETERDRARPAADCCGPRAACRDISPPVPRSESQMALRSSSTSSSDSRICSTAAVSVMSCVVAPQCAHSPRSVRAKLYKLLDDGQNRIADRLGALLQLSARSN